MIPEGAIAGFLLELSMLCLVYMWVWRNIISLVSMGLGAVKIRADMAFVVDSLVGQTALAGVTAIAAAETTGVQPQLTAFVIVVSITFLLICIAPFINEDYGTALGDREGHVRWIFFSRVSVLLLLLIMTVLAGLGTYVPTFPPLTTFHALIQQFMAWDSPVVFALGIGGAYSIFRSILRTVFGVAGILESMSNPPKAA